MISVVKCSNNYSATRRPDFTIIVPVSIYHYVSYAETYSRYILTRQDGRPLPTWGAGACCSEDRATLRRGLLRLQCFQDSPRRHRETGHTDPDSVGDRIGDRGQRR